jgi:hypothetical protein
MSELPFAEAAEAMALSISKGAPPREGGEPSLDYETLKNLAPLVEINRLGLITHDSQPGENKEGLLTGELPYVTADLEWQEEQLALSIEEEDESGIRDFREYIEDSKKMIEDAKKKAGYYYRTKQRAYISGLMKPDEASRFISWINTNTDKHAFSPTLLGKNNEQMPPKGKETILVTETVVGPTKETAIPQYPLTTLKSYITPVIMEETRRFSGIKDDISSLRFVDVFDPVFGRRDTSPDGLYADVLRGLRESAVAGGAGGAGAGSAKPNAKANARKRSRKRGTRRRTRKARM